MYLVILGVIFIGMKVLVLDPVATWSWWWVLSPFAVTLVWWWWADVSGYNKRKEIEKMEKRKVDRRQAAMDALGTGTRRGRK
jgi:small Trp-rich protein